MLESAERFLIIKPGAIGDTLHMTPVIRAIKKDRPKCQISFLAGSDDSAGILRNNPYLDEVLIYEKGRGVKELLRIYEFSQSLRVKKPGMILNYQPSNWRWRILCLLLHPTCIRKYKKQKKVKPPGRIFHAVEDHLHTLSEIGISGDSLALDFFLTEREIEEAQQIIGSHKRERDHKGIVGLILGASHCVNRWPVASFYKLDSILTSHGFRTLLIGGPEDKKLAGEFFKCGRSGTLDLTGRLTIRQTGAVLGLCDTAIGGDTGPLHLATAAGTRVVGIFGPADPLRTGPVGPGNRVVQASLPCVPCRKRRCKSGTIDCMRSITPGDVWEKIKGLKKNDKT